ncbi:hypothetical protein FGO68_gene946 [Halteria grandinella]|uniref:Uncharacterized protein n=1 Tax=Halteria grandinella TaxID=5974 RepID=A0A8J8NEG5_HALGN|nr:hypothetical protein FGO68_gene946 [Halteria grandinella]
MTASSSWCFEHTFAQGRNYFFLGTIYYSYNNDLDKNFEFYLHQNSCKVAKIPRTRRSISGSKSRLVGWAQLNHG